MSGPKAFASLSPTLLARKGGAKPAMRPQLHPIQQFKEAVSPDFEDDLGWNDHGEDIHDEQHPAAQPEPEAATRVVQINGDDFPEAETDAETPEVIRQRKEIVRRVAKQPRQKGRRVAFTLRLDAERHLKLRLASAIDGRSAQQIVTEALDRLIAEMAEVDELASRLNKRS